VTLTGSEGATGETGVDAGGTGEDPEQGPLWQPTPQ
jgi:hypothetical protein